MHASRWFWLAMIVSILAVTNGCAKTSVPEKEKPSNNRNMVEPHTQIDESPSVLFDLKPSSGAVDGQGFRLYDCTYQAQGKTAKFRLQFKQDRPMSGDFPIAPGEGKFLAVSGSDSSVLLKDLRKALEAKAIPGKPRRIAELAFDAAVIGEHQSRESSGGFSSTPAGDWMAIKIFLPKGGDDAEVFLNLNPVLGKGEFSIKDSDYGDYLLKEFAQVL
jgi:hypothetical protein